MDEYITTEAERAYRKRYYEKNRARILESRKRRYADNKENELQRSKQYSMTHDRSEYFRQRYLRKKAENARETHLTLIVEPKLVSVNKVEGEQNARVISA